MGENGGAKGLAPGYALSFLDDDAQHVCHDLHHRDLAGAEQHAVLPQE